MKCPDCGVELKQVFELNQDERNELIMLNLKEDTAKQALEPEIIKQIDLHDSDLYNYLKVQYDTLAEAKFLIDVYLTKIGEKYNKGVLNYTIFDGIGYTHNHQLDSVEENK